MSEPGRQKRALVTGRQHETLTGQLISDAERQAEATAIERRDRLEERIARLAAEAERLRQEVETAEGRTESPLLPHAETIAIMTALDEVRAQLGMTYPGE